MLPKMEAPQVVDAHPNLAMLPRFFVRAIAPGEDTTLLDGSFDHQEGLAAGDRGWLFVSETESTMGDVVAISDGVARLDVPNRSMTPHIHLGTVLPWLDGQWHARDLAFLLDETREWRRVSYRPTDAVVFAQSVLRCTRCGWTGNMSADVRQCQSCSGELTPSEIFGDQEASFPLDSGKRFVKIREAGWDHAHCLICDLAIGRDAPCGYRESSYAEGPNSVGLWFCENCFARYLSRGDFSFLVR